MAMYEAAVGGDEEPDIPDNIEVETKQVYMEKLIQIGIHMSRKYPLKLIAAYILLARPYHKCLGLQIYNGI